MQSENVKEIIEIENQILTEHEHLRQELDLRLQQLKEKTDQACQQRRQQLEHERRESLERIREEAEKEKTTSLEKAKELASRLDGLEDETLKRCIVSHLKILPPGVDDDRQDDQS